MNCDILHGVAVYLLLLKPFQLSYSWEAFTCFETMIDDALNFSTDGFAVNS
jgi:hypothetical protein